MAKKTTIDDCAASYAATLQTIDSLPFSAERKAEFAEELDDFKKSTDEVLRKLRATQTRMPATSLPENPDQPDIINEAMRLFQEQIVKLNREIEGMKESRVGEDRKAIKMGSMLMYAGSGMDTIADSCFSTAALPPAARGYAGRE